MGLLTGDKKTDALLVAGGIAALAGVAYYAYQNKLLGNFFSPGATPSADEDEASTPADVTTTTTPATTTTPIIPGGAPYYPIVPPPGPLPWQYNYIFNPTVVDDGVNSVPQTTTAFDQAVQAAIDRGTSDQDTQVIIDVESPKSTKLSSTCKKCYSKCKNAKKSKLKECQKCGAPCGFTVKLSKNRVKVTKQSNLVLALEGQYYTPRSRVYDQGFVVRDFG